VAVEYVASTAKSAELVREYRADLVRRGLLPSTVAARMYEVRRWVNWRDDDPLERDEFDIDQFLDHRPTGFVLGPRARYTAISHLHDFYEWAIRARRADHDPTIRVVRPRLSPGLPRPIEDDDLALAVGTAGEPVRTMLMLAALGGLRCGEIHRLRWVDVSLSRAEVRVMGKGRRERVVPVPRQLVDHLVCLPRRSVTARVVLASSACRVSQLINQHLRERGIVATAHQLRHWYATQALRSSRDISVVQALLGHASPTTTAIYAKLDRSSLAPVVARIVLPAVGDAA
jgi:integrase/recombinase XerD